MKDSIELSSRVQKCPDPMDERALYGPMGAIVLKIEGHTESDRPALMTEFLGSFGNCVNRGAFAEVDATRHYPNISHIKVGDSAKGRKQAPRAQAQRIFRQIDPEWVKNCRVSGLSSGEGLIYHARDPFYRTEEKDGRKELVLVDEGAKDKRIYCVESEFASVLKVMQRSGSNLSAVIRDAFDGVTLRVLTKNSPIQATDAHISISADITSHELKALISEVDCFNGLLNRFLLIHTKRARLLPFGGEVESVNLESEIAQIKEAILFGRRCGRVRFAEDAKDFWRELYKNLAVGEAGLLGAVTARGEALILRLAMIYALTDLSSEIKIPHLMAATALWDFSAATCKYVFGDRIGDPAADKILDAIAQSEIGLTRTQIRDLFSRNLSESKIESVRELLLTHQRIRIVKNETEGRPTERWEFINE